MSVAYRVLAVEAAIPYEDVTESWDRVRDGWVRGVVADCKDAKRLAGRIVLLLDALLPQAAKEFWRGDSDGFVQLRRRCLRMASTATPAAAAAELLRVIRELELRAIEPPVPADLKLMGEGEADVYSLGHDGPLLEVPRRSALSIPRCRPRAPRAPRTSRARRS